MADAAFREQRLEAGVLCVAPGIVGLDPLGLDPECGEERERALDKARDGLAALVAMQLGVGDPRVVIDDRVGELVADVLALLGAGRVAVAGDGVAGTAEAREALVSICSRSPGQGHSKRRTSSLAGFDRREHPRRSRQRETVACGI